MVCLRCLIMAMVFALFTQVALGQATANSKQKTRSTERQREHELERHAKRDFALSLIISLADETAKFEDRVVGVRV